LIINTKIIGKFKKQKEDAAWERQRLQMDLPKTPLAAQAGMIEHLCRDQSY